MAIFPNLRVRLKLQSSKYFHPCLQGRIPVVIISAFLDLEKNISFSDNLLGLIKMIKGRQRLYTL